MTPPVRPPADEIGDRGTSPRVDEAELMSSAEVLADRSLHASPGCACGVNGAGEFYVDPICRPLYELEDDPTAAEAASSTALDQPGMGAGYTAVEPRDTTYRFNTNATPSAFLERIVDTVKPAVLDEETARGQIAAIIAMSDDGTDMLDEIMSGPVAALVATDRARLLRHLADTAEHVSQETYDFLDGAASAAERRAGR